MHLKPFNICFLTSISMIFSCCSELDKSIEIKGVNDAETKAKEIAAEQEATLRREQLRKKIKEKQSAAAIQAQLDKLKEIEQEALLSEGETATQKQLAPSVLAQQKVIEAQRKLLAQKRALAKLAKQQKTKSTISVKESEVEAEAKLAKEIATLKKKLKQQELAREKYLGTQYETLKLNNGKTLYQAKVIEIKPTHVTYAHSAGIANVKFTNLSKKVREMCQFDPELARYSAKKQAQLQQQIRERLAAEQAEENKKRKATPPKLSYTPPSRYNTSKPQSKTNNTRHAKGSVSVRTLAVANYRALYGRNTNQNLNDTEETYIARAYSNVPALLVINSDSYPIKAHHTISKKFTSTRGKYKVTIRTKDGKVLDQETHPRKTGLSIDTL